MASVESLHNGSNSVNTAQEAPQEEMTSPLISDADSDSNEERPTLSPTPTPPPAPTTTNTSSTPQNRNFEAPIQPSFDRHERTPQRTLHVPAPLRRNNSNSSFMAAFNEIPSLPTFLNNCNLSQYLQSFNDAGAADDSMPLIIDFDEEELKSIMEAIPMKPFHAVTFRKGIRDLRERSRMGSMHFDNSQNSFMQPEPHSMLHYSHSQFFQQPSQPSQSSQLSQASHPSQSSLNSSQPRRYHHHGTSQTPGLYRQSSSSKSNIQRQSFQANSSLQSQGLFPTPSQVLSAGAIYQYVGPAPKASDGNFVPQSISQEQPTVQRSTSKTDRLKRRRSSSSTPPEINLEESSPVFPEPSSFNSNSSSSWGSTQNNISASSNTQDPATREMIMHQALIFGKHSSRSLTKYEQAINDAAQRIALDDPSLLTTKGELCRRAKAKLLEEDYEYKRGRSRSKLPEAQKKKDHKISKERLIQKREANASNAATLRLRRIASLGEHFHRKTAEREALLANLLHLESPEYRQKHPNTFEVEARNARGDLARVENERQILSKELGSLKNKERKHQWYEKRKRHRVDNGDRSEQDDKNTDAGTDAEADEEAETDTTVDPEGDASQKSVASKQGATDGSSSQPGAMKVESTAASKPLTWKTHKPTSVRTGAKPAEAGKAAATSTPRSKKHKDVFRASEYTPVVKT
ncbi:hypothetical protein BGX27_002643 [Mortierella sp. AM989]|nr:hypothetical protein BGX27_002643 [Mortierella sp. AM989]